MFRLCYSDARQSVRIILCEEHAGNPARHGLFSLHLRETYIHTYMCIYSMCVHIRVCSGWNLHREILILLIATASRTQGKPSVRYKSNCLGFEGI